MTLRLYWYGNVDEQHDFKLAPKSFFGFPRGLPYRPAHISWTMAVGGVSAASSGAIQHRSAVVQLAGYGPIKQDPTAVIWTTGPILIPWGQRVTGRRRVNVPWFTDADYEALLYNIEVLCLEGDTASVSVDFVISATFHFRAPEFSSTCPALRVLRDHNHHDDSDDDFQNLSTVNSVLSQLKL